MKAFFDTSVLIPFSDEGHVHHHESYSQVFRYAGHAAIDSHVLAETYATLSGKLRKPPQEAALFVRDLSERFEVVELTCAEYLETIADCAARGITGGAVYDALHATSAVKAGASVLYTWNVRDFIRLGPDIARLVRTPAADRL